jgi:cytochrome c-type biogenesis protein CcmH
MKWPLIKWIVAALLLLAAPAHAVDPREMLPNPALEKRARALSAELRCVVCQNQSIDESDAELAKDLRVLIRDRILAGDTDQEVLEYITARYGEFVLLRPPVTGATAVLWIGPILFAGLGAVGIVLYNRRRRTDVAS